MTDIPQEVSGMIDPVAAMTELKSRLSPADWRTICDYIEAERELVRSVYEAAGKRAGMERAAEIAVGLSNSAIFGEVDREATCARIAQAIRSENDGHG